MSQHGLPNYPFIPPNFPNPQVPQQRFQQMMRGYNTSQYMDGYSSGYQSPENKPLDGHEQLQNLKYEYGSPSLFPAPPPEPNNVPKPSNSGIPKVTTLDIESLLIQNYTLFKALNESTSTDDPDYISNFSTLHQNLMFLARISDQQN